MLKLKQNRFNSIQKICNNRLLERCNALVYYFLTKNLNKMKKIKLITLGAAFIMFFLAACEKSEEPLVNVIEGTYVGTLTNYGVSNDATGMGIETNAIAEITKIGNEIIELHMYSDELDTTMMLNYYQNRDSVEVCFTGDEFENVYGHMLGQGHMSGGMMGDIQNDETEWMHHLNDEHQNGDEHFGGFNMQDHTFGYRFNNIEGGISNYMTFEGKKE
jgi:hypothetical protein